MQYFFTVCLINITILFMFGFIIVNSYLLDFHQKQFFGLSILCTIVVIVAEILVSATENNIALIPFHIAGNVVGFGVSAFIPILIGSAISSNKNKYDFLFWIPCSVNLLFSILSAFIPLIFTVTSYNEYIRGNLFLVYITCCAIGFVYLFIKTVQSVNAYQNINNKLTLYILFSFVFVGSSIEVIFPSFKTAWLCITFSMFLYYMYFCELYNQIDFHSNLLNKNTYCSYIAKNKSIKRYSVIFFDIDSFKPVNDNYGHQFGDFCIASISSCIKNVYFEMGVCFRIGGDEFCVISETIDMDILQNAFDEFTSKLDDIREKVPHMPTVSVGYACYDGEDMSINDVFFSAEREMYKLKNSKKK